MASVNKAIIVGHLGKDPESRYLPNGDAVCNFSVATSETWKDKTTGEKKELTEWHRISVFGKLAEICAQYLTKGAMVYIEGRLQTRKWQDKDGQDRYTTEIRCDKMSMLDKRQDGDSPRQLPEKNPNQSSKYPDKSNPMPAPSSSGFQDFEDDIPF